LVDWHLKKALSAQTVYIMPLEYEICRAGPGDKTNTQLNNTLNQKSHLSLGFVG